MDINEGSHIHSIRIKHFIGALYDYERITDKELEKLVEIARDRERQGYASYPQSLDKWLNELARALS